MRLADHNLSCEVRVSKTQRNTHAGLRLCDTSREAKQESDEDEYAFHGSSLVSTD